MQSEICLYLYTFLNKKKAVERVILCNYLIDY